MPAIDLEAPTDLSRADVLFDPVNIGTLTLGNRIVMAPMTRAMSPEGVPGEDVAHYYRRRAEGGVGLIITEGAFIPHRGAGHDKNAPRLHGEDALAGWKRVVDEIHRTPAKVFPQLWHVGLVRKPVVAGAQKVFEVRFDDPTVVSPSGVIGGNGLPLEKVGKEATLDEISDVIKAYGLAATSAKSLGFDGVEIHGAHGYLIDQFLWEKTNFRRDDYGGSIGRRGRFAVETIREIRRQVGPDFPVTLRLSTWKQQDYSAKLAATPDEWSAIVGPLADAGVDAFHISQRRYWEGEFGSDLNLAGWTKKLTGKPTITVGSVSLDNSMAEMMQGQGSSPIDNIGRLLSGIKNSEFDMVAIGRAMIANPDWATRIRNNLPLTPYSIDMLRALD
jgi:2,4-dienoyl-CoA reductase-like NADH-dependent reductase (Old Yellow Enzyme family)